MVTARVELRPSGNHQYAVVVQDVWTGDRWQKRTIRSFGNAANPANVEEAQRFANAITLVEAVQKVKSNVTKEDVRKLLLIALGAVAAGAVLAAVWEWLQEQ